MFVGSLRSGRDSNERGNFLTVIGILVLARAHRLALPADDVRGDEVVAGETVLPHQPADPTAEREAADARRRDEAAGRGEPRQLRLAVDVRPSRAGADDRASRVRIDVHVPNRRKVENDPPSLVENPATLWPPPGTATSRSALRAKASAVTTSAPPLQRTTNAGRRASCTPFQILWASSYPLSVALRTSADCVPQLLQRRLSQHRCSYRRHAYLPSVRLGSS
jgi:hypothetical protein